MQSPDRAPYWDATDGSLVGWRDGHSPPVRFTPKRVWWTDRTGTHARLCRIAEAHERTIVTARSWCPPAGHEGYEPGIAAEQPSRWQEIMPWIVAAFALTLGIAAAWLARGGR